MKIGHIRDISMVDGPGNRLVIFFTGCGHNCDGCHNPKYQDYNYGIDWEIPEIIEYIKDRKQWIDGITLSGGDPLFQPDLREFLETIRSDPELKNINIWMWTGFTIDQVPNPIKSKINVIIDGKYDKELEGAKWRGSSNQKIWKRVVGHHFELVPEEDVEYLRFENE